MQYSLWKADSCVGCESNGIVFYTLISCTQRHSFRDINDVSHKSLFREKNLMSVCNKQAHQTSEREVNALSSCIFSTAATTGVVGITFSSLLLSLSSHPPSAPLCVFFSLTAQKSTLNSGSRMSRSRFTLLAVSSEFSRISSPLRGSHARIL